MNRRRPHQSARRNDPPVRAIVFSPNDPPLTEIPCVLVALGTGEHGGEGVLFLESGDRSMCYVFPTPDMTSEFRDLLQDLVNEIKRPITVARFTARENVETFYPEIELT